MSEMPTTPMLLAGTWTPPPVTEAGPLAAWLLLGVGLASVLASLVYAAGLALARDRENAKLFWLITLGALVVFSFYVEPWMDVIGATTYMTNVFDPVVTIVDRPIPWHVVVAYTGGIGVATMGAYLLIRNGRPARELFGWAAFISVTECLGEMISCHYGVMLYYDNKALVFGVPMPSLIQNGGMFVLIGATLAALLPRLHGWRRAVVVPFVAPAVYLAYTLLCTLPSYYAIHNDASTAVSWGLSIVSTALNLGAVIAAAYAPTVVRLRTEAARSVPRPRTPVVA
ncbi:hypothetical protein F5X71_19510 [Nocardia brasiliensis]|uniref:Uncharacterized protein n=1 Tax=Nocardia brasiliensis TaxID=37326 RepID=A0A6G9XTK1_NOCBR|nr:hypothetical protein [Nocardia brasiliensis]QIS04226.1 hypothetical protein F5X71_19510 [Nocardia brasiliensis]